MNCILRSFVCVSFLTALAIFSGCGGTAKPPAPVGPPTAITLDEWKAMKDIDLKYDGSTIERLRMSDPNLKNDRNWNAYEKANVLPERTKDFGYAPGQQPP